MHERPLLFKRKNAVTHLQLLGLVVCKCVCVCMCVCTRDKGREDFPLSPGTDNKIIPSFVKFSQQDSLLEPSESLS